MNEGPVRWKLYAEAFRLWFPLVISLCAISLTVFQAMSTRRHARLSVQPRIEWRISEDAVPGILELSLANVGFGPLVACNDFALEPGGGFDDHEHRAVEIVTWVAEGAVSHDGGEPLTPGRLQVVSSGNGITHAEKNPSAEEPARFLQRRVFAVEHGDHA